MLIHNYHGKIVQQFNITPETCDVTITRGTKSITYEHISRKNYRYFTKILKNHCKTTCKIAYNCSSDMRYKKTEYEVII